METEHTEEKHTKNTLTNTKCLTIFDGNINNNDEKKTTTSFIHKNKSLFSVLLFSKPIKHLTQTY